MGWCPVLGCSLPCFQDGLWTPVNLHWTSGCRKWTDKWILQLFRISSVDLIFCQVMANSGDQCLFKMVPDSAFMWHQHHLLKQGNFFNESVWVLKWNKIDK